MNREVQREIGQFRAWVKKDIIRLRLEQRRAIRRYGILILATVALVIANVVMLVART